MTLANTILSGLYFTAVLTTVLAEESPQPTEIEPEVIEVVGKRLKEGYRAQGNPSTLKTGQSLKDSPQSLSIISSQQMQNQGAKTAQEALRYSAGSFSESYGFETQGFASQLRGARALRFQDGLLSIYGTVFNVRPSLWGIERIEVLRGPSSFLYGQSSPGGLINLISKQPLSTRQTLLQAQYGSFDRKEFGVDVTGPIDERKIWSYRVPAEIIRSNTQVDHVPYNSDFIAPSISWQPSADTSLILLLNYQRDQTAFASGFFPWVGTIDPAPYGRIPSHRFIGEPDYDHQISIWRSATTLFQHRLNSIWRLQQTLRYSESKVDLNWILPDLDVPATLNPDNRTMNRIYYSLRSKIDAFAADNQAIAEWGEGVLRNRLLLGLDFQSAKMRNRSGSGVAAPLDVYSPSYGKIPSVALAEEPVYVHSQSGIYAMDESTLFEKWILSAGVRWDKFTVRQKPQQDQYANEEAWTKHAAVSYRFDQMKTGYVSYGESFLPAPGYDIQQKTLPANTAQQLEAGVKYEPLNSQSILSLAVFTQKEKNRLTNDPDQPLTQIQLDKVKTGGVEFEAVIDLEEGWQGNLAYSFIKAKTVEGISLFEGHRVPLTPEQSAALWLNYNFQKGSWRGFSLGGGARYVGESYDGTDRKKTPDVLLFDGRIGFQKAQWALSLSAQNIADKVYLSSCQAIGNCFYGPRQNLNLTVNYSL